MKNRGARIIIDTNVWLSFLIGKRLSRLQSLIQNEAVQLIVSEQLLEELQLVTSREKLQKYFDKTAVSQLISLLNIMAEKFNPAPNQSLCRDPKDNFLLDLISESKAEYLITGDKGLLGLDPFLTARILSPSDFEDLLQQQKAL